MSKLNKETFLENDYLFLSGGGEMGMLMRKKDWSKTPVGNPETWPQSLKTTLGILINSRFPMFLWWGPELICFYNDAYRPSLGENGKHPDIFGMPAREAWPEIWDTIQPLIDQVLTTGEATWAEDQLIPIYRNGALEDVYWTFSYSPVNDEYGKIAGVLVTCNETTDKVVTLKKLAESKDQLEFAIEAADLATWDLNPFTNKFTGNDRLKEWHGLSAGTEFDLENGLATVSDKDREILNAAISQSLVYSSGGVLDLEYAIVHPVTKTLRIVRVKGKATFDEHKIAYRLNGTLQDVTQQAVSRKQVEESELRFRTMAESSDILIGISDETGNAVYFNKAWESLTGLPVEHLFKFGWADLIHPEDRQTFVDTYLNAFEKRISWVGEFRILNKEKQYNWLLAKGTPRTGPDGSFEGYISSCIDITERKKAEEALKDSEQRLRSLVESAPFPIGVYVGREMRIALVNESILNAWGRTNDVVGKLYADVLTELTGQGVYEQLDSVFTTGVPFHAKNQYLELMVDGKLQPYYYTYSFTPLYDNAGKIYGVLNTAANVTDTVLAAKKIEASEKEFRQLADSLPELVWTTDCNGNQTFASKRWREYTGLDPYDETTFAKMVHPDDLGNILKTWSDCLATGNIYKSRLRLKSKENDFQWFYVHGEPIKNEAGAIEKWVGAFTNLNDQIKTEEELHTAFQKIEESEKRFRNVANSVPVFIWMAGPDGLRNFYNTAWLNFTGRSFEQEKGNGWAENVHPEDFKRCIHLYHTAFKNQEEFYMEYRLRRFDGEYRWVSAKGVPRLTSEGIFEGFIGACMDIHERVVYQKKLKEDEERLNIIIGASELGTWELNVKTDEVQYSDRFLEILGFANSPFLTHEELLTHLHPGDLSIRAKAFEEAFATGILQYESRLVWDDQSVHWMEVKGKVFYDEHNEPSKLIGTVRDITEEKYFQQELLDREQKFRLLADSMPQLVWTGDAAGNLNYFNQSVYNYSGLTAEEMNREGWLQIVHPDDREENIERWLHAVNTGEDFLFEHRFRRNDGVYRWQLSRAIPQKDAAGNIQMWVGTSTDIQDIKEQDQQKDFFISMASHELKTPLTSIKGYVQVLKSMHANSEDTILKKALATIDKQIITLTDLISAMLDLSKIKTGKLSLNKEDFPITEVIRETVEQIQHLNSSYTIVFINESDPVVYADKNRIGQVLINFLTNAVKYSPESGQIKVQSFTKEGQVFVSVTDNGIGISKTDQKKIFERFYRVEGKNEKTFPGFGIGLFIAADIVQKHDGTIGVCSEQGKGSEFYFSIPLKS